MKTTTDSSRSSGHFSANETVDGDTQVLRTLLPDRSMIFHSGRRVEGDELIGEFEGNAAHAVSVSFTTSQP